MKTCNKCKIEKLDDNFSFSEMNKKTSCCKLCVKSRNEAYYLKKKNHINEQNRLYYENNKHNILDQRKNSYKENRNCLIIKQKNYYQENKEQISIYQKEYVKDNFDALSNYHKNYQSNNKIQLNIKKNKYEKQRWHNDSAYRLRKIMSNSIYCALYRSKQGSITKYLSYSFQELKQHLETQFESWMTLENHGKYDPKTWNDNDSATWNWQIDHIVPHSTFKYTSMKDQAFRDCWALSNLRPYSAKQNCLDKDMR